MRDYSKLTQEDFLGMLGRPCKLPNNQNGILYQIDASSNVLIPELTCLVAVLPGPLPEANWIYTYDFMVGKQALVKLNIFKFKDLQIN